MKNRRTRKIGLWLIHYCPMNKHDNYSNCNVACLSHVFNCVRVHVPVRWMLTKCGPKQSVVPLHWSQCRQLTKWKKNREKCHVRQFIYMHMWVLQYASVFTKSYSKCGLNRLMHLINKLFSVFEMKEGSRDIIFRIYSISQEICTRFCCALLCCGYAIVHNEFTWSIYPYSSGLL